MPKVTYIEQGGDKHEIELDVGTTLMEGAMLNGVEGIEGDCGGGCRCATCHIYVDSKFINKLDPPEDDENEMLGFTISPREPNSRLGCQIEVSHKIDGIIVNIPIAQS